MKDTDRPEFVTVIQTLAATFRVDVTDPLLEAYWLSLQDVSLEEVKQRAVHAMKHDDWFPKPCQLRSKVGEYRRDLRRRVKATQARLEQHRQKKQLEPPTKQLGQLLSSSDRLLTQQEGVQS